MKSSMRQWRRIVLVGMLAWVLLFLGLLSYFLDARVNEPLTSVGSLLSQHPDARRLASVQAAQQQRARPEPASSVTTSYPRDEPGPSAGSAPPELGPGASRSPDAAPDAAYGETSHETSRETSRQDELDPQSLAAWSAFGTENVGSHSNPSVHSRERTSHTEYQNHVGNTRYHGGEEEDERDDGEEEEEMEEEEVLGNRIRTAAEEPPFSKSASVVQRLWRGGVAAAMLSPRLQRAMKDYVNANKHHVLYAGERRAGRSATELLCQLKAQARLLTVDGSEPPFSGLGWAGLVPPRPLERSGFRSCAVVTSAGAILHSGLGKEIDNHDAVLRFNAAPTAGYERDVGNKTTIRVINSQILANAKHRFNTSSIYKNVTLVAWDPAPYIVNLHKVCALCLHKVCALYLHKVCALCLHKVCALCLHKVCALCLHKVCALCLHKVCAPCLRLLTGPCSQLTHLFPGRWA
ncbi:Beta-galactoside alpha-2,6-sialyltransferase 2 [Liparis tanakae]|uniref:Beta-galactoside alpha-2,6-sialyltransferase 2 n=1 Tax=Liparis tanakae TaxID=230148 RepID=A0A4Z2F020_9TELE|nr:Beta-galactoside alpha-2,6-sialyltransferase 2 [Liparis tanakae]